MKKEKRWEVEDAVKETRDKVDGMEAKMAQMSERVRKWVEQSGQVATKMVEAAWLKFDEIVNGIAQRLSRLEVTNADFDSNLQVLGR